MNILAIGFSLIWSKLNFIFWVFFSSESAEEDEEEEQLNSTEFFLDSGKSTNPILEGFKVAEDISESPSWMTFMSLFLTISILSNDFRLSKGLGSKKLPEVT